MYYFTAHSSIILSNSYTYIYIYIYLHLHNTDAPQVHIRLKWFTTRSVNNASQHHKWLIMRESYGVQDDDLSTSVGILMIHQ